MSQEIFRLILYKKTKEQTDLHDDLLRTQFVQQTYLVSLKTYGALLNDYNCVNFINSLSFT